MTAVPPPLPIAEDADMDVERTNDSVGHRRRGDVIVWSARVAVIVAFLLGWQYLPKVPNIRKSFTFLDPFFISSPTLVAKELRAIATGQHGAGMIWAPLARTVITAMIGTLAAMIVGAVFGLAVSNWRMLSRIARPFLVVLNAIPRIAVVPIIVLIVRNSQQADAVTAFSVVFFLAFYNAVEGAGTVPREMLQSAQLLGSSNLRIMWKVRWPYALGWTLASLPNAIAFGLTGTITTEIFTGGSGLGYQLLLGVDNSNANLLFAIVVVTALVGVILVLGSAGLRRVLLPWWESNQTT